MNNYTGELLIPPGYCRVKETQCEEKRQPTFLPISASLYPSKTQPLALPNTHIHIVLDSTKEARFLIFFSRGFEIRNNDAKKGSSDISSDNGAWQALQPQRGGQKPGTFPTEEGMCPVCRTRRNSAWKAVPCSEEAAAQGSALC